MERYTGPIGLVIILLIGIATVLLVLNMNKRIKGLPKQFPEQEPPEQPPVDTER